MPRSSRYGGKGGTGGESVPGEVYIEFQQVGQAMRVTAIDAASGEEVVVMGPASASQNDLQRVAVRKLKRKLGLLDDS